MIKYSIDEEFLNTIIKERSRVLVGVCMKRFEILDNKEEIKNEIKELIYEHFRNFKDLIISYNSGIKFTPNTKQEKSK